METIGDISTPVVVLKLEHYGGLGIVRSLGRLGIEVYGMDGCASAPGLLSRYCQRAFVLNIDNAPPAESVSYLIKVGRRIGTRAILLPTSDETAIFVAENASALRKWYVFPEQPSDLVRSLCDKKRMYALVKRLGIPTAETVFPQSRNDILEYSKRGSFPVMLKAIDGGRLERRVGKKMVIVRNGAELLEEYTRLEDLEEPNLMLQEYIPGEEDSVWMFNGYFNSQSECLLGFTGKKIRQNPVYTGMTSLGICLPNRVVETTTKQFMKAIGYHGILDIGYRFDARDGLYKVMDVNPRIGATFRLFVADNGMDVVRALYLDLTGQPVPRGSLQRGRKWLVEDKDLRSSIQYFRDRNLEFWEWVRSFRGVEELGYFALDDMLPFWVLWRNHLLKMVRKIATWTERAQQTACSFTKGMTGSCTLPREQSRPHVPEHATGSARQWQGFEGTDV